MCTMSSLFTSWRSAAEVAAEGAARRSEVPVEGVARYEPAADRPDPMKLIEATNEDRVPDLIALRYRRMAETPFTYLRGAATVMAHDITRSPDTGLIGHICGDAHASNFGFYASPERRLIMDVNDFDETIVGPWEWDLKRLVASVMVAARSSGLTEEAGRRAVRDCAAGYRAALAELATMSLFDGHHMTTSHKTLAHIDMADIADMFERTCKKARTNGVLRKGHGDAALILQVKQARPSALPPCVSYDDGHEGQRVNRAQRWPRMTRWPS